MYISINQISDRAGLLSSVSLRESLHHMIGAAFFYQL